jgi:hypothetical protein
VLQVPVLKLNLDALSPRNMQTLFFFSVWPEQQVQLAAGPLAG